MAFSEERYVRLNGSRRHTAPLEANNKVLVVTQCTGKKHPGVLPTLKKYGGGQAVWVRRAAESQPIDVLTLSAGYGWLQEAEEIDDYNQTFNDLKKADIIDFGKRFKLREELEYLVPAGKYDLIIFALGASYLQAIDSSKPFDFGTSKVKVFCSKHDKDVIGGEYTQVIPHKAHFARTYGAGIIALKGRMVHHLLHNYSIPELIEDDSIWTNL